MKKLEDLFKEEAEQKLSKMAQEGGTRSSLLWKMLKECEDINHMDEYGTTTEDGRIIKDPEEAKENIAD